jgi:hypothetical protein
MIKFLKNDLRKVWNYWNKKLNRNLPMWLVLIYYVIMFPVGVILTPIVALTAYIYYRIYFSIKDRA